MRRENPWITRSSRTAYQNQWIRVREDEVLRPDGTPGIYGVVEVPASVGIVAVNQKDYVVLIGQWRYTLSRYLIEIPRGGSDGEPDILTVAQRELAEEAGLSAARWQTLGAVEVNSGITTDIQHLFLATELSVVAAAHDRSRGAEGAGSADASDSSWAEGKVGGRDLGGYWISDARRRRGRRHLRVGRVSALQSLYRIPLPDQLRRALAITSS